LEEEVARLGQEKERLDQERAGALEAGRQANEELKNRSRELAGKSHFAAFIYTTFLLSLYTDL
jgi:hypothetical protein